MNEHREFVWYQRPASAEYGEQADKAYATIVRDFIPVLQQAGVPHEFIYCKTEDTTNITFETKYLDTVWEIIFSDAGFKVKHVPLKDAMAQADLKEAIIRGSDFGKRWH